jgi:hypothetical protein
MATVELKLELPDGLAREAEARGLLTSESIEAWLRDEIQREDGIGDSASSGVTFEIPPPTKAELQSTLDHLRRAHIRTAEADRPP